MKLTAKTIENAKLKAKPYKLSDGAGLYILINPKGSKLWRWKYRIAGKEKSLSIGKFPAVSLKAARTARYEASQLLEQGIDPSIAKRLQANKLGNNSFQAVAEEWIKRHLSTKSASYQVRVVSYLEKDVFPFLGMRPIGEIKAPEIIPVIDRIHKRVARDTHLRVLQSISQIMRYGIATGRRDDADPCPSLKGLFPPKTSKNHFPAITDPIEVGQLLRTIDSYPGDIVVKSALQIASIVMLRPGSLARAEWTEIDFDSATWTIEVKHMKADTMVKQANRPEDNHIIPLPTQAITLLKTLIPLTGHTPYIFLSPHAKAKFPKPISRESPLNALHNLGFKGKMTSHGFRSMASTLLNDMRRPDGSRMWDSDAIERQLSHKDRNAIRAAYNRGEYLEERRRMLQHWADYLDGLRDGADVIPFRQASG